MKKVTIIALLTFILQALSAQPPTKIKYSINESWQYSSVNIEGAFQKNFNDSEWLQIDFPHTWNAIDAVDDTKGYSRKIGWYRKNISIGKKYAQMRTIISFEGANQITEVFINGEAAGKHIGGYSGFNFDITKHIKYDTLNTIAIKVDNRHNVDVPPLGADFTFFGGVYRDVYIQHVNNIHFDKEHFGSNGVYITTPKVTKKRAEVHIKTRITNKGNAKGAVVLVHRILDASGKLVVLLDQKVKSETGLTQTVSDLVLNDPQLWSPDSPYLYRVVTQIVDKKTQKVLDEVINPLGMRWFEFTSDKGFFLNGEHLKLIGTNRHQCYLNMGNALEDEMHIKDIRLLKDMGGNFLRIAHYPQDPTILQMCDKLGIIASVEIPIVNKITQSEAFYDNCISMTKDMLYQNYNHPSLFIWAYMNEVLLQDQRDKESGYGDSLLALTKKIEQTIRAADPYRYTMIPSHGNFEQYKSVGLTSVPMILGWNLYPGWYGANINDFEKNLDDHRKMFPDKPLIVTEYGADVNARLHSFEPDRFDYTVEYGNIFHAHYLKEILARPHVAGANIWNLNDFHSEHRGYAKPHINLKGITTLDREKKDTYWLYQAALSETPVLRLGQREWTIRGGVADQNEVCIQPVEIYTNAPKATMILNGKTLGEKNIYDYKTSFDVPFVGGWNTLEAVTTVDGKSYRDVVKVDFRMLPQKLNDPATKFTEMNIMLGSNRYYEDKTKSQIWLPEQPYTEGSWGYIGGKPFRHKTWSGEHIGSAVNISNTEIDPVYQTQRVGLSAFKMDLPKGKYMVTLNFAELQSNIKQEELVYNLGSTIIDEGFSQRVFNVLINGNYVEENFDITDEYGAYYAISKKYEINVIDDEGIHIEFESVKGNPVLNSIRVFKVL